MGCFAFTARREDPGAQEPSVSEGVLTCECNGTMSMDEYMAMLQLARQGCERVAAFARLSLEKAFQGP